MMAQQTKALRLCAIFLNQNLTARRHSNSFGLITNTESLSPAASVHKVVVEVPMNTEMAGMESSERGVAVVTAFIRL